MALGVAPALIRLSIAQLLTRPSVDNLRVARACVAGGTAVGTGGGLTRAVSLGGVVVRQGVCWLRAQTAAQIVIVSRLGELEFRIRQRVPRDTGRARRSVAVGKGEAGSNLRVFRNFDFDIGHTEIFHAGIGVVYAPYLRGVDEWFNEICDEWFEEVSQRAIQTFLVVYARCATVNAR